MNRIVREHYPVSQLPEDLRTGFAEDRPVLIVIVQDEAAPPTRGSQAEALTPIEGGDFTRFKHLRRAHFSSSADVDTYLDDLRNEWAHREQ